MASNIQAAAQTAQRDWQQSMMTPEATKSFGKRPIPPNPSVQTSIAAYPHTLNKSRRSSGELREAGPYQRPIQESRAGTIENTGSPNSDDSVYNAIQDCMNSISSTLRGKGSFYCPLGTRCSKGGVAQDGTIIEFQRNSAFKYNHTIKY